MRQIKGNELHPNAPNKIVETGKSEPRQYVYDGNGNPTSYSEEKSFRKMTWDEENRLTGINDNGRIYQYTYDASGERVIKSSGDSQNVAINGETAATIIHTDDYTGYVSPYFVVRKGKFTKHYFEGAGRIVSKLGNGTFAQPLGITAGGVNYTKLTAEQQKSIDTYVKSLGVPPGPPTQQGIYATPEFTGNPYPSEALKPVEENQEPPLGWPRNPMFNAPGDVPGPPVQFGPPVQPATVKPGEGFTGIGLPENDIFYFHSDHLGSTSYISNKNGSISQHVEYIAFGEVLFEEHSSSFSSPYLFNGKELDGETNLTYYGARYLDMKTSLWLNVDPLALYNPIFEEEFYFDGDHNGGIYNSGNLSNYNYCYQNPVLYVDPDGKQAIPGMIIGAFTEYVSIVGEKMLFENKTFAEANKDIDLRDGANIVVAGAFGAVSGVAKFTKWAGSSTGRKILIKMLELGLGAVEDMLKQYVKGGNIDLTQTLISTLTDFGMGYLLKGTSLEKHIAKQEDLIVKAENEVTSIVSSTVGTAKGSLKKIRKQEAIIATAKAEKAFFEKVSKPISKTAISGATLYTTGIYKANKKKKDE